MKETNLEKELILMLVRMCIDLHFNIQIRVNQKTNCWMKINECLIFSSIKDISKTVYLEKDMQL